MIRGFFQVMKMHVRWWSALIFCLSLPLISGCGAFDNLRWSLPILYPKEKTAFTHDFRHFYQLGEAELRRLNYYVSDGVVLARLAGPEEMRIDHGRLMTRRAVEEVVIKADTPGVVVGVGENWLDISFEEGSALRFGSDPESRALWEGKYSLLGVRWEEGEGLVPFDGETYFIKEGSTAYLLVTRQFLYDVLKERRVLPGREL